jgi:hypothetical protein
MISLESYKDALGKINGVQQCACFVSDRYFEQHKDDNYVIVITCGWSVSTANELFDYTVPKKFIGKLSDLNKAFSDRTLGINSRTPRTLYDKLINNRKINECIVLRPLVKELDYSY